MITRAAGAVGVGLLLTAGPASARIVYTPAYTPVVGSTFPLDLNHDGITDFEFRAGGATTLVLKYRCLPRKRATQSSVKFEGWSAVTVALLPATLPRLCRQATALDRQADSGHTELRS